MGLSSNVLWHQTNIDGFKAIIKSMKLTCSYSLETVVNDGHKLAFPMVSLSDIALADINEYLTQYGGYLFGFSREWVKKSGFNPVWYCEKDNPALTAHKKLIYDNVIAKKKDILDASSVLFIFYSAFIKEIEGPLTVKSKNITYKNYRYYDEREYRYIPDMNELLNRKIEPVLSEEGYVKYKNNNGNGRINETVSFDITDLKIIIVRTAKQVTEIQKYLSKRFPGNNVHVFSHEEIKQNIIGINHSVETERNTK